ncbi:hypothetical protein BGZ95_004582 [Linnemannia exigua]|uniref:F-box domain-containing protein n=1 Tax=Linnemannia exigua TaxID=604196 RepID=A0AAD4D2U4_9FUNG|nr:hypothetical protein BGZ95_004582 [Linnemannia exigua]
MDITHLPEEILLLIGTFINRDDIISAASTCHTLRVALTSLLWNQLVLPTSNGTMPVDANTLRAHAHFIHTLTYRTTVSPDYSITFPVLTDLHFDFPTWPRTFPGTQPPPDRDQYFATIIRLCPRVQNLTFTNAVPSQSVQLWNAISSTVKTPYRLSVTRMDPTGGDSMQAFWSVCTLFEELELIGFDILVSNELPRLLFPRLKRLTQELNPYFGDSIGHAGHLAWMMRCPNLTYLEWRTTNSKFPGLRLEKAIRQITWPKLDSFQLTGACYSDERVATLLQHLPPQHVFRLPSAQLSALSFSRLQERHFSTLRILDMNGCVQFSSSMALAVLCGCPLLEDLSAYYLTVKDMGQLGPARLDWVCLGLKQLKLYIARDPEHPEDDRLIIDQLSKLKQLEQLEFGSEPLVDLDKALKNDLLSRGVLQLNLASGLTCLAGLKNLAVVTFLGTVQRFGVEEIRWMQENWPELQEVSGTLSECPDTCAILREILQESGIGSYED